MTSACRTLTQDWYDRFTVAAATAIPSEFLLFNRAKVDVGGHLTNNPEANKLPQGHSMLLLGLEFSFVRTEIPEMDYLHRNYYYEFLVEGKLIYDGLTQLHPQTAGSFGIEGANGASSNGVTGAGALRTMLPGKEFLLEAGRPYEFKFVRGKGAASRTTAAGPAEGINCLVRWLVDWTRP